MFAKWEEMFGSKDEDRRMKDERLKMKKPREKAVATSSPKGKKEETVALRPKGVSKGGMKATGSKTKSAAKKSVKKKIVAKKKVPRAQPTSGRGG